MSDTITRRDHYVTAALTGLLANPSIGYPKDKMLILDAIELADDTMFYVDEYNSVKDEASKRKEMVDLRLPREHCEKCQEYIQTKANEFINDINISNRCYWLADDYRCKNPILSGNTCTDLRYVED